MGQYNTGVLTTAGQQLITQALAGDGIISFPLAKTSSWAIPAGTNIQALTDLQDIQQTVTPGTAQIFNGTMIQVQALFSNANQGSEVTEAYLVQTVGLWAQITGGEPTLFSVYQATTPDQMPAYAGKAPSSLIYTLQATVQQASQLTVQVNPAGAATALDIQNLQTQITQIENDYIPKTQIGAASGVAGLGSNSAVPIAQGGTGGNTITEALANLGAQPGFNLLVNSRFKYNGRNQTSYTGGALTVDGWDSAAGSVTITLPGGVTVTSAGSISQLVHQDSSLFGKSATLSVADSTGTVYSVSATMPSSAQNTNSQIASQSTPWGSVAIWNSNAGSAFFVIISATSAVTLTAAKLEIGSVSTLAADLATAQDETLEQLRLDMYDLDPGRPAWVLTQNENLLDNWYFVGGGSQQGSGQFPINQRGQTSYGAGVYCFDRWKLTNDTTAEINSSSVTFTNQSSSANTFVEWRLPWDMSLTSKQITASLLLEDGTLLRCTGTTPSTVVSTVTQVCLSPTINNATLRIYAPNLGGVFTFQIMISPSASVDVVAAKLELGTRSTLARLVNGQWVLNDPPPNFQQELAKCQYYQRFIRANGAYSPFWVGSSSSNAVFFKVYGAQMRITPTVTASGNFALRGNGETVPLSGNKWGVVGANEPTISASGLSGIAAGQIYQLLSNNDTDAYILLDANL